MDRRVDLPEPDWPMMATNSPSSMKKSISLIAWTFASPSW
jgi:hypothetical protein